jgi:hypothetical protein
MAVRSPGAQRPPQPLTLHLQRSCAVDCRGGEREAFHRREQALDAGELRLRLLPCSTTLHLDMLPTPLLPAMTALLRALARNARCFPAAPHPLSSRQCPHRRKHFYLYLFPAAIACCTLPCCGICPTPACPHTPAAQIALYAAPNSEAACWDPARAAAQLMVPAATAVEACASPAAGLHHGSSSTPPSSGLPQLY